MAQDYSVEVCQKLRDRFHNADLHRPMQVTRYDAGAELVYDVTSVTGGGTGQVRLVIERFVGGGFAGQVYRVKVLEATSIEGQLKGIEAGGIYAMKILVPPSRGSLIFRNLLYAIGFQGPFQLQVNPTAARAGALWQKFIRRGASIRFGTAEVVNDIHATFIDDNLGSCGELSNWVDGRTWRLEVDENLDTLDYWRKGKPVDDEKLGSPEYRSKHKFMAEFVSLLHDMGGREFARQYEWSTCKSQPNCLKLKSTDDDPSSGLIAVDFRAGLALLPFLPMSPGDFKLIAGGLKHGSLVQFDRGDIKRLEKFIDNHSSDFADMRDTLAELKTAEQIYRDSIPDITHNHVRLLYSKRLWSTIFDSAVTGWKVRNIVDDRAAEKLRNNKAATLLFFTIGLIPFLGGFIRKIWARADQRKHYAALLTCAGYFKRAIQAKIAEKLIAWHRAGRVTAERSIKLADSAGRFFCQVPLSILPAPLHRFLTDTEYRKEKLAYICIRPIRLYFNAQLRKEWLSDMVAEGQRKHILTDADADTILTQLEEPFIQKYLVSLVVHLLTLPVTQIVSVIVAVIFYITHPDMDPTVRGLKVAGILVLFQIIPVSPGSFCRGAYTVYMAIKDRSFKDYNIAVFLSFFKYIGYLAFPIQMTYHYPAISRFMASHWATEAVHIVPVFGERGAILEHWVFCLFYNWPLTIRRRIRKRTQIRIATDPRYWHVALCAVGGAAVFAIADSVYLSIAGQLPNLIDIWYLSLLVPLFCGAGVTLGCGGAMLSRRIIAAAICGIAIGALYSAAGIFIAAPDAAGELAKACAWRIFAFAIFATMGAILTELKLPDPDLRCFVAE